MDFISLFSNLIISVISNGVSSLVTYLYDRDMDYGAVSQSIREKINGDPVLSRSIKDVLADLEEKIRTEDDAVYFRLFLESPSTESIIRRIFSDSLDKGEPKTIGELKEEFSICFAEHVSLPTKDSVEVTGKLFSVIVEGCRKSLDIAIEKGDLSALEAKSVEKYRIVLDEIKAIKSNLDFLKNNKTIKIKEIIDFESKYRNQVGARYRLITVPHFDEAPRMELNRIFVSPNFIHLNRDSKGIQEDLSMTDFFRKLYRTVVLGDPGGGKSTLAQKICYELSLDYNGRLISGRLLTPVIVILREYSTKKKENGVSIIEFIENEAKSKYQLSQDPPKLAFDYLLHNGHIIVIFDGLDELLDASQRREIRGDIESFCNLFPAAPVLVTSRIVGYEQAPLDSSKFETLKIAPFSEEQVGEYVRRWFDHELSCKPDEKEKRTNSFMKESRLVPDLRSNPLMLALMCTLYRGAGFIPRNRPQVYEKCSEMLFERWDPSRGIWVHHSISEPKFLLCQLAYWIYSNESLQSGVKEDLIVKISTKFLYPRRFESEEEAEKAAKEFISFCRGRAWVFTDAGTTPGGESLYKFTHKTFLEYFTAEHILRNFSTPNELWKKIGPKIAARSWDVVAQLSFQKMHERVAGSSDKLLVLLLENAEQNSKKKWIYLSFGARCLQFLIPSRKTVQSFTKEIIRSIVEEGEPPRKTALRLDDSEVFASDALEIMAALEQCDIENRQHITKTIKKEIANYSKSRNPEVSLRAFDFNSSLILPIGVGLAGYSSDTESIDHWRSVRTDIYELAKGKLVKMAQKEFLAFLIYFEYDNNILSELFKWYTPNHLFYGFESGIYGLRRFSIAEFLLYKYVFSRVNIETTLQDEFRKPYEVIGDLLLKANMPCFYLKSADLANFRLLRAYHGVGRKTKTDISGLINSDTFFGAWCLLAIIYEISPKHPIIKNLTIPRRSDLDTIAGTIRRRDKGDLFDKELIQDFRQLGLSGEKIEFITQWIDKKRQFLSKDNIPQTI